MTTSEAQNREFEFFRPRPDGDIDPAGEAGWFLQRQREEAGIGIEEASNAVNIHPFHLAAIEQGDLTGLPPRVDAMDMIGTYAMFLGFDAEPLVGHFSRFLPSQPMPGHRGMPKADEQKRPAPLSSAKILKFPILERLRAVTSGAGGVVASCLGAIVLFGAASWAFMPSGDTTTIAPITVAEKTKATKPGKVASVTEISEQPMPDTGNLEKLASAEADKAANSLSGLDKLIAKSIRDDDIQTASIPLPTKKPVITVGKSKANAAGGRIYGTENKSSRLVLQANSNVWVRIEDAKGNVVMTRTLMSGDSYRVPARKGLVVISRDGGLLSFAIDGAKKGNLGSAGEILVGRSLDLAKLSGGKS